MFLDRAKWWLKDVLCSLRRLSSCSKFANRLIYLQTLNHVKWLCLLSCMIFFGCCVEDHVQLAFSHSTLPNSSLRTRLFWFHSLQALLSFLFSFFITLFHITFFYHSFPPKSWRATPRRCLSSLTSHQIPSRPISSLLIFSSNHNHHTYTHICTVAPNHTTSMPASDLWSVWSPER